MGMYGQEKSQFLYILHFVHNLGQSICRLFHALAQFLFTTNKTELDFYHQKLNVRVASRVAERLRLSKLENFKKIPEMFWFDGEYPPKKQILTFVLEDREESAAKHFIEKAILLNYMNLPTIFFQDCTILDKNYGDLFRFLHSFPSPQVKRN